MEKFTVVSGHTVRYNYFGNGDITILLIHGYLESMEVWDNFGGQLGKTYRVIMLDLPGSGWSQSNGLTTIPISLMADVVSRVLDKEHIKQCVVVGHSMGGYVAIELTKRRSDLVSHLVLLHSSPNPDTIEKRENRLREINLIDSGKKDLLAKITSSRGFAPSNTRSCSDYIEELYEQILMTDDNDIVATLRGLMDREDNMVFFNSLSIPRLMIFGSEDNYIPVSLADQIIESNPSCLSVFISNAGHMSFIEQPDVVLGILRDFMGNK